MNAKLKVYTWNLDGKRRALIAATSWAKAVAPFRTTTYHACAYGGVVGNEHRDAPMALARPGVPFVRSYAIKSEWEEYAPR